MKKAKPSSTQQKKPKKGSQSALKVKLKKTKAKLTDHALGGEDRGQSAAQGAKSRLYKNLKSSGVNLRHKPSAREARAVYRIKSEADIAKRRPL